MPVRRFITFLVSTFHIAQIPAEAVLIQLFSGLLVPQPASVRGDLIRQDDGTILQTAEFQLEIHQSNAYCQEEFLQGLVDLEGQTNDGVDLRLGRQFQGLGMVGIDEGSPRSSFL